MIKRLFLLTALLAPGLAFGANPSAPFSDLVVPANPPGSIACDIGPNAPSIPLPAQKAGFTHCALNADFTSNTTDSNGWNFSQPSTYVSECGGHTSSNNTIWHVRWNQQPDPVSNNNQGAIADAPCSRVVIKTDPTYGNQALYLEFLPTDYTNGQAGIKPTLLAFNWPADEWGAGPCASSGFPLCAGGPNGAGLPQQVYAETTWRITPSTLNLRAGTDTIVTDWWQEDCNGCGNGTQPAREIDFFELQKGYCNGTSCNMQGGGSGANYSNVSQYTTTGFLVTSDGNGNTSYCTYVGQAAINSGVATACGQFTNNATGNTVFDKLFSYWLGGDDCFGNTGCLLSPAELYVQNMRVWFCSKNYWTSECYGTLITSDKSNSDPWYKRLANRIGKWIEEAVIAPASAADVFDRPYQGYWKCPDGRYQVNVFSQCMPQEFKIQEWWESCVAGRSDCVLSDTAYIGIDEASGRALRGRGYCYTEQPYTCSPDGKLPQ